MPMYKIARLTKKNSKVTRVMAISRVENLNFCLLKKIIIEEINVHKITRIGPKLISDAQSIKRKVRLRCKNNSIEYSQI